MEPTKTYLLMAPDRSRYMFYTKKKPTFRITEYKIDAPNKEIFEMLNAEIEKLMKELFNG